MTRRILTLLVLCLAAAPSGAQPPIRLCVGESKVIAVGSASKVAVGNPEILEVTAVSGLEVLVTARSPGSTNLLFVSPGGRRQTRTVTVTPFQLKKAMIEVAAEIMEIESSSALKAGLDWGSGSDAAYLADGAILSESDPPHPWKLGTFRRENIAASVQLLIERGKARVLARPKLLAVSGEEAGFLAGGEIPYVLENGLGNSKVEWKPYGVRLKVRPTADGEGNIQAVLRAEVSGPDLPNGASMGGTGNVVVPALKTRWAETTVYMKGGTTLVIAGLIQEEMQRISSGVPLLSEIPILGELFRSTRLRKRQTELVVFVTPRLTGSSREGD